MTSTPRRFRAIALPALALALAAPAAAHAGTASKALTLCPSVGAGTGCPVLTVVYDARAGEDNAVQLSRMGGEIAISDPRVSRLTAGSGCRAAGGGLLLCGKASQVVLRLGDRDDVLIQDLADVPVSVDMGEGDDRAFAGRAPGSSRMALAGGPGFDRADYGFATAGVTVRKNRFPDDGRAGDADDVQDDVESVLGGPHDDLLVGNDLPERFEGMGGNDTISMRGGDDFIDERSRNGADVMIGGAGTDTVLYEERTEPLSVTLDTLANDGEAGEGDDVSSDIEGIRTGSGDDVIVGSARPNGIFSNGGDDVVDGRGGGDLVSCGDGGRDRALVYAFDQRIRCEGVGTFRLLAAGPPPEPGITPVALRWRHPERWTGIRSVTLHLRAGRREVGTVVVSDRGRTVRASRGVWLVRRLTRVRAGLDGGRAIEVRLALRIPGRAGRTLAAAVSAVGTDRVGQSAAPAGLVRVR